MFLVLEAAQDESTSVAKGAISALVTELPVLSTIDVEVPEGRKPVVEVLMSEGGIWIAVGVLGSLLQAEIGYPVAGFGMFEESERRGVSFFECLDKSVGRTTAKVVGEITQALTNGGTAEEFASALEHARSELRRYLIDQNGAAIIGKAKEMGVPIRRVFDEARFFQLGWGYRQCLLRESLLGTSSSIGIAVAVSKAATLERLRRLRVPVPRFRVVSSADDAVDWARELGRPVVLKPLNRQKGLGITINVTAEDDIRKAFETASIYTPKVLVETFIPGDDHRLLVVGDRVVAAAQRIPGGVVGNGRDSIEKLLAETNSDPRRGRRYEGLMNLIVFDDEARSVLSAQGLDLHSVPKEGLRVPLRRVANISQGGTAVDVTDRVHPVNAALAVRATKALGLAAAGVDFITPDISRPCRRGFGAICELNVSPGLRPHWIADPSRDVVTPIVEAAVPVDNGRVPTVAVTGTHGKTTVCRMVAAILGATGAKVGLATTDGVQVSGEWVARGDFAGPSGFDVLVEDPTVEAAVLETARGGILKHGFGFDMCDVAAVICVDHDHIGVLGVESVEEMAKVKGRLVPLARKAVVLNAGDPLCRSLSEKRAPDTRLIWVLPEGSSRFSDELGESIVTIADADGDRCLVCRSDGQETRLMPVSAIPAILDGRLTFNVMNALFAAAIALGMDVPVDQIRKGLGGFKLGERDSPGRYHVMTLSNRTIVIDFAHNPSQVGMMSQLLARQFPDQRRVVAFTAPGWRLPDFFRLVAEKAVGHFEHYVCYEHAGYRRDNPPGQISQKLAKALLNAGIPRDRVSRCLTHGEAVEAVVALSKPGDVIAVLFADPQRTPAHMRRLLSVPRAESAQQGVEAESAVE